MNSFLYKIVPILIIIGFGCSNSNKSEEQYDLNLGKSNSIKINLQQTESFDPKFKVKKYVALEVIPDSYFADIDKLVIHDNTIYIMDAFVKKKVFAFDIEGDFIRTYGAIGDAPGEYQKLTDFEVDKNGGVQILDRQQKKIHIYSKSGEFKMSKSTDFRAEAFKLLEDGYLFSLVPYSLESNLNTKLIKTDAKFNVLQTFFNYPKGFKDLKGDFDILNQSGDQVLYHKPVNDSVFLFDSNGELSQSIDIDFGSNKVPHELKNDHALLLEKQSNSNFLYFTQPPILFNNILLGHIYEAGKKGVLLIDIENQKSKRKLFKPNSLNHTLMEFPVYNWNDSLLVSYVDIDIMENDKNKEQFPEDFQNYIKEHNGLGLVFSSYGAE
ncbi:MAG: 6-bladed beta-propeller [Bacteroidota bacterium]